MNAHRALPRGLEKQVQNAAIQAQREFQHASIQANREAMQVQGITAAGLNDRSCARINDQQVKKP
jgi:hypothetical protein